MRKGKERFKCNGRLGFEFVTVGFFKLCLWGDVVYRRRARAVRCCLVNVTCE